MASTKVSTEQIEGFTAAVDARVAAFPPVAGVATDLSNLTNPTSVSQSLLPNPDNTKALGSATKRWASLSVLLGKFYNAAGTFYTGIKAGTLVASTEFVLPIADGTTGQALTTDGAGNLGFTTVGGGGGANTSLSNLTNPTSVNRDLLPSADATRSIGSTSFQWNSIYSYLTFGGFGAFRAFLAGSASSVNALQKNNSIPPSSGMPFLTTENSDLAIGPNFNNGIGGVRSLYLTTPDLTTATTDSGKISLQTGDTTSGVSGEIFLKTGVGSAGNGKIKLDAVLNLPSRAAPAAPVNGDVWFDGTDFKARVAGVTKTFTLV